jgi:hypothetical protein
MRGSVVDSSHDAAPSSADNWIEILRPHSSPVEHATSGLAHRQRRVVAQRRHVDQQFDPVDNYRLARARRRYARPSMSSDNSGLMGEDESGTARGG